MHSEKFKNKYRIASTRFGNWDYGSSAYYFVTICTKHREYYFGNVINGKMELSELGGIAHKCWGEIPQHFPFVLLDEFVVMPNHVHGIIAINEIGNADVETQVESNVETQNFASLRGKPNKFGPQSRNLASIIRGFKIGVKKYATMNKIVFFWQPRFYDHIVRNDGSLNRIRNYISGNPGNWGKDKNNSENLHM